MGEEMAKKRAHTPCEQVGKKFNKGKMWNSVSLELNLMANW